MTREEAIEAMQNGEKVTHRYFAKDEWATMEGHSIITEDGVRITENEFWLIRKDPAWSNEWSIFNSAQTS